MKFSGADVVCWYGVEWLLTLKLHDRLHARDLVEMMGS